MALERTHRFTLVADMLALTIKEARQGSGGFTLVTDAYATEGGVLTMHRQLRSVKAAGEIYVMQEPTNNVRHTFIYRRSQQREKLPHTRARSAIILNDEQLARFGVVAVEPHALRRVHGSDSSGR